MHAYITHGVLSGPAVERIAGLADEEPRHHRLDRARPRPRGKAKNIRIVPVAPLLGQAILNIANGTSVSSLFDAQTLEPIYEAFYPTAAE